MPRADGITWGWCSGRQNFPQPCGFCGEPIHPEFAYREENGKLRCERCLCAMDHAYNQHEPECRMPSAGESACRCFDLPHPLKIVWALTRDTYTTDGEKDAWEAIGQNFLTLEDAYAVARGITSHFIIVKFYVTYTGRSGPVLFKGFNTSLPPLEVILQRSINSSAQTVFDKQPLG